MKTILLLGGSAQQVVAILKAKELGYRTVLCDYLPDNPGKEVSDVFYLVSTTDLEAVLEVAKKESVNGVLAYASDPAALTAAFVADQLELPSNPLESIQILSKKNLFREYLKANGFNSPNSYSSNSSIIDLEKINGLTFPVIIKPIDSSGSKGVSIIYGIDEIQESINRAREFSRSKTIIIEEFIQKSHTYQIGGDVFVSEGKVVVWGLLNCHRSELVNPLVPIGKSFPVKLSKDIIIKVKSELERLLSSLSISMGAFNIEVIVDTYGRIFFVEVGPRNGGNLIPELLQMITGIDLVAASIESAMGNNRFCFNQNSSDIYLATHNLFSTKNGYLDHIEFSPEIQKFIIKSKIYKKQGDLVEYFDNASNALGIVFLHFNSFEEQEEILNRINTLYEVVFQ